MKYQEISKLNKKELFERLAKKRKDLFSSRIDLKTQNITNPLIIRTLRRDIAKIKTALNKKEVKDGK